ncbi:MAG: hypothetical protein ACLFUH_01185 [Bacteroidales bacterium]
MKRHTFFLLYEYIIILIIKANTTNIRLIQKYSISKPYSITPTNVIIEKPQESIEIAEYNRIDA